MTHDIMNAMARAFLKAAAMSQAKAQDAFTHTNLTAYQQHSANAGLLQDLAVCFSQEGVAPQVPDVYPEAPQVGQGIPMDEPLPRTPMMMDEDLAATKQAHVARPQQEPWAGDDQLGGDPVPIVKDHKVKRMSGEPPKRRGPPTKRAKPE